ncbi:MAG TPA: iron-containing alcohol dehydrogenase [Candidatus Sulfotelmatobacter sp.]|nr:iron-containing alcohol dehydrogenase [Candidatus Sulfotelmatobacter sp.]
MDSGAFTFQAIERIVYGKPAAEALKAEAQRLGATRVFLMVSGTMNRTTDEVAKLRAALGNTYAGLHDHMPPHTPRDAVIEAANQARDAKADLIVTFGGGSLTDAGKVVQLCLRHNVTDMDGLEPYRAVTGADGKLSIPQFDPPIVRQITIPTTLSGGEFSWQAGCTDPRIKVKQSFRHPLFVPRAVILDPAPTVHTPMWVFLSTGMRAFDHATESLCSLDHANPVWEVSAQQAIRLLRRGLLRVKQDPSDLAARLECQLAVWLSLAGRQAGVNMGASHAIGHILGGTCDVPHGYTSCVMLPHVMRYNRPVNAARQRLVAEAMGQPDADAADLIAGFVAELGLPGRLSEVGVTREQFPVIAKNTMHDPWLYTNPRKIGTPEQVTEILEAAA